MLVRWPRRRRQLVAFICVKQTVTGFARFSFCYSLKLWTTFLKTVRVRTTSYSFRFDRVVAPRSFRAVAVYIFAN